MQGTTYSLAPGITVFSNLWVFNNKLTETKFIIRGAPVTLVRFEIGDSAEGTASCITYATPFIMDLELWVAVGCFSIFTVIGASFTAKVPFVLFYPQSTSPHTSVFAPFSVHNPVTFLVADVLACTFWLYWPCGFPGVVIRIGVST